MRTRLLALIIAVTWPLVTPAFANEQDSEVVTVGSDKFLRWFGHAGRTYFIQVSDPNDHLSEWTWAPIIETGNDGVISYDVGGTADKGFFRLWFTDQATSDPDGDDFDNDMIPNLAEVSVLSTNPLKEDSDNDSVNDWDEDSDADGIPDGWEALAIFSLPAGYGISSISQITTANIVQISSDAELELPPGVVSNQITIQAVVPSSEPYTNRPESVWSVPPSDLTFSKSLPAPASLGTAFPEWHFNEPNALVLVKNSLTSVLISASSETGANVKLMVLRDPADSSQVGSGPLTLLPYLGVNFGTLSLDSRGSFYVVGWLDSDGDDELDAPETAYVLPVILVDVDILSVEHATGEPIAIQTENPDYLGFQFGKNESDFNPHGTVEQLYGEAGISARTFVKLVGGKDGMRGTDRVMGGWSNNIEPVNSPATYRKDGVPEPKAMPIGYASNQSQATGWEFGADIPAFKPNDPAPTLMEAKLLDKWDANTGINGMNAPCLTTSRFSHEGTAGIGRRIKISCWDSPKDVWPEEHPYHAGYNLTGFQATTAFSLYLTFWSSPKAFDEVTESTIVWPRGMAGERTYQTGYRIDWNTLGFYELSGWNAVLGANISVPDEEEFSPVKEPKTVNHETRPPTSFRAIHFDAR